MDSALKQGPSAYDAVSIHPYVFKIGKKEHHHAPRQGKPNDLVLVNKAIRQVLTKLKLLVHKPLWITEIGFPVGNNNANTLGSFPPVTEQVQKELIGSTFAMFENNRAENLLNIKHVFDFNIQDGASLGNWDAHAGLYNFNGGQRPAWFEFTEYAK